MGEAPGAFKIFMTKKNCVLIIVVLVLAGVYVIKFTSWFKRNTIEITHASRAMRSTARPVPGGDHTIIPVHFSLEQEYRLKELKVVPLAAFQTNHSTLPVWHLISESNSVPIDHFSYGNFIGGMKPAVSGTRPQPLQPGVTYRLFVTAGSTKGQHDFQPVAR